jgi:enolase-phosphatase E1
MSMPKAIITDIEGTTTDINFVHNVLFPYAAKHLPNFIRQNVQDAQVRACLTQTLETMAAENQNRSSHHSDEDAAIAQLLEWIEEDRKHPALKSLQGLIWKKGYEEGAFHPHVYDDVLPALKQWYQDGITLGVYSSGSIEAQQYLFRYSIAGDLTAYFSHYFDTNIGAKREQESYHHIQEVLNIPAHQILFLSDIPAELEAASAAGFQTIQLQRDERTISSTFKTVSSFSEIALSCTSSF